MVKLCLMIPFLGLLSLGLITQVQAAECSGSHNAPWGGTTWADINTAMAEVCNMGPKNGGAEYTAASYGYQTVWATASVGSGGSVNCWGAMQQILYQCFDTNHGQYAIFGSYLYGDEFYTVTALPEADCDGTLGGYQNPGC